MGQNIPVATYHIAQILLLEKYYFRAVVSLKLQANWSCLLSNWRPLTKEIKIRHQVVYKTLDLRELVHGSPFNLANHEFCHVRLTAQESLHT